MYGWDHPDTARYYEAFCEAHRRYQRANAALIRHAALVGGERLLDVAAGTGRTAEQALTAAENVQVVCFEPSAAMRGIGWARLRRYPQVSWTGRLPATGSFERILCGAAIWQMQPLSETLRCLTALLAPAGKLVFNMPSQYLGKSDPPGGGEDPMLHKLPVLIAGGRIAAAAPAELLSVEAVDTALADAGLKWKRWRYRSKLTQAALRDWIKIPVLTDALLGDLDAEARAARIDTAFALVDPKSWRWEEWTGWTACLNRS